MQTLIQIIPPALAVSFIIYLSIFFGKIINDQKPFVDNRKWDTELSGLNFSLNLFWFALLSYGLATLSNFWAPSHFGDLVVLSVVGAMLFVANKSKSEEIYQIRFPNPLPFADKDTDEFFESFANGFNKYAPLSLLSIILLYILIVVFVQGNFWWFSIVSVQVFLNFIFLAVNYSLRNTKLQKISIYFTDNKRRTLKDVLLIKVNEDNVRIRANDKIFLVNKSEILKIEIPVDEKFLFIPTTTESRGK